LHAWIDDVFATYWQCLTRIVGWNDASISGGRGGGMEKLVIVAISLILLTESQDRKHVTVCLSTMLTYL